MAIGYKEQSSASVTTPASGEQFTFVDSADGHLKRKNSSNVVTDIETGAGSLTAADIANVPAGDIIATDVQAAINELDSEKAPLTHVGTGGVSQHPIATGADAGFMSPSDFTKLGGIAAGATANQTDAYLLARANHTGTQTASTISDFTTASRSAVVDDAIVDGVTDKAPSQNSVFDALALKINLTEKAAANGVATLDATSKIPIAQIPSSVLGGTIYQGTWDASSNSPALASSVGTKGYYYVVNIAGSTNLDGVTDWKIGDWAIFNGAQWQKVDNTDAVTSVNGFIGAVVLTKTDVGLSNVDNTSDATKDAAVATLTNKTISGAANTLTNIPLASAVTGVLPTANGGTNASTISAARVNLGIEVRSTFSDAPYTVLSTDEYVAQIGTMTASRVVTLPAANTVNAGRMIIIADESGSLTDANNLVVTRSSTDLINGATTMTIGTPYAAVVMISNGSNKWTVDVQGVRRGGLGTSTAPTDGQVPIGSTSTGKYTPATVTAGAGISVTNGAGSITIANTAASTLSLPFGMIGDGVDGDVTISSNITLTRDMYYNNLTVNAGFTLNTGGFCIFVEGTLTIQATGFIARNGANGGNSATTTGGTAGAAVAGTTVGTSGAGAAGATGSGTGNGANGGSAAAVSGEGGAGGVGGNAGSGNAGATLGGTGGNGGTVTARWFRNVQPNWKYTAVGTYMPSGTGGGGGSASGGDGSNVCRGGGGGGSAGGEILIICDTLNSSGTIQCKGGNGGNGANGVGNTGGGGGGGSGGGGKIMILANTITSAGTLDVSAGTVGAGGTGAGTGLGGGSGGAGAAGYATRFAAGTQTWTTTS